MLGQQFYHETIRKIIVSFGTLFNDIHITRKDSSGNTIQSMKIPLAYGAKQKFLARVPEGPNLNKSKLIGTGEIFLGPSLRSGDIVINGIFNITGTGAAGVFVITPDTVDGGIYFNNGSSNKGALTYLHTDETMNFRVNGTNKMTINTDGDVIPGSNNSQDLGSSSLRWANVFTNDLNLSNKGSTNSVDNTWGDYTIQEGESDLFLINNRSGKKYKFNLTEVS